MTGLDMNISFFVLEAIVYDVKMGGIFIVALLL
jgi:hypothetical protein